MKRFVLVALPIVSAFLVFGVGFLLVRSQASVFGPRISAVRRAIGQLVEEVAEEAPEVPA
jgi:hypothetical protein